METSIFTRKNGGSLRRQRVSGKAKHALLTLMLAILGLGQAPAVNAQAEAMAPLIQMGVQLAASVAPMVIPIAITGAVMGARAAAMAPSYIKAKVSSIPRPHFRRKKVADASVADAGEDPGTYSATESVSGEVVDENSSRGLRDRGARELGVPQEEEEVEERPVKKARRVKSEEESAPVEEQPARPKAPSEWYQD